MEGFGAWLVEAGNLSLQFRLNLRKERSGIHESRSCTCITVHTLRPDPIGESEEANANQRREVNQRMHLLGAKEELRGIERDKTNRDDIGKRNTERSIKNGHRIRRELTQFPCEPKDRIGVQYPEGCAG